eukprot:9482043-Pyramimonas_sp.AAC.2
MKSLKKWRGSGVRSLLFVVDIAAQRGRAEVQTASDLQLSHLNSFLELSYLGIRRLQLNGREHKQPGVHPEHVCSSEQALEQICGRGGQVGRAGVLGLRQSTPSCTCVHACGQARLDTDTVELTVKGPCERAHFICILRAYTACVHYMRILHAYTTCVHYMRTLHAYTTCAHYMRTLHAYTACVYCMRTLHAYTACVHYMRTLHAYTTCVHYSEARHAPGMGELVHEVVTVTDPPQR